MAWDVHREVWVMAESAVVQYMAGNGHSFSLPPPPLQPPLDEPFCSWLNIFKLPTWIAEGLQETHLLSGRYMYCTYLNTVYRLIYSRLHSKLISLAIDINTGCHQSESGGG